MGRSCGKGAVDSGRVVKTASAIAPHRCWAEIDLGAISHNVQVASAVSRCGVIAVIKANAYSLGAMPVARALDGQVAMFGVAALSEALELRAAGIRSPVLILGARIPAEREMVIKQGFCPCISSVRVLSP